MLRAGKLAVLFLFCLAIVSCQKRIIETSNSNLNLNDSSTKTSRGMSFSQNVIYGEDDRLEYYQVLNPQTLAIADSTVVMVYDTQIKALTSQTSQIKGDLLKDLEPGTGPGFVCNYEPFANQPAPGICSGALVGEDIIMTAGHCMDSFDSCDTTKFVFGFAQHSKGEDPTLVDNSNIYSCKKVLSIGVIPLDYSFIQLDRPVKDRKPLKLRSKSSNIKIGDSLYTPAYPYGLPLKISGGARVRSYEHKDYFRANLDTYIASSGAPVINEVTGEVEGIVVEGDQDWVKEGNCYVSHRCKDDACRGETVLMANRVLPILEQHLAKSQIHHSETTEPSTTAPTTAVSVYESKGNIEVPEFAAGGFGVMSSLNADSAPNGRKVYVRVNIKHPYRGDLSIRLHPPTGKPIILFFRTNEDSQNLVGTFGDDLTSLQDMRPLSQISVAGTWFLQVEDKASEHQGILAEWSLIFK